MALSAVHLAVHKSLLSLEILHQTKLQFPICERGATWTEHIDYLWEAGFEPSTTQAPEHFSQSSPVTGLESAGSPACGQKTHLVSSNSTPSLSLVIMPLSVT